MSVRFDQSLSTTLSPPNATKLVVIAVVSMVLLAAIVPLAWFYLALRLTF